MPLTRGVIESKLTFGQPRVLTRDDLAVLREKRPPSGKPIAQRLRDPHHRLARLLAMGHKTQAAAELAGYSYGRVMTLNLDPGFKELVAQYRNLVNEEFKSAADEFYSTAVSNMSKAERQIAEHFDRSDEEGELLPLKDLVAIASDGKDRFGYEKKKSQTNLNINADFAGMLEKAIARSGVQIESVAGKPVVGRDGHPGSSHPGGESLSPTNRHSVDRLHGIDVPAARREGPQAQPQGTPPSSADHHPEAPRFRRIA